MNKELQKRFHSEKDFADFRLWQAYIKSHQMPMIHKQFDYVLGFGGSVGTIAGELNLVLYSDLQHLNQEDTDPLQYERLKNQPMTYVFHEGEHFLAVNRPAVLGLLMELKEADVDQILAKMRPHVLDIANTVTNIHLFKKKLHAEDSKTFTTLVEVIAKTFSGKVLKSLDV